LLASAALIALARSDSVSASSLVRAASWPPTSIRRPSMRAANSVWPLVKVSAISRVRSISV